MPIKLCRSISQAINLIIWMGWWCASPFHICVYAVSMRACVRDSVCCCCCCGFATMVPNKRTIWLGYGCLIKFGLRILFSFARNVVVQTHQIDSILNSCADISMSQQHSASRYIYRQLAVRNGSIEVLLWPPNKSISMFHDVQFEISGETPSTVLHPSIMN